MESVMKSKLVASIAALVALTSLSLPAARASVAGVTSCSAIKVDPSVKKGITLPCLDSASNITFQGIRGPVVVNVFGSWCAPCQEEIPHFLDLAKSKKVAIVGIDVEEASVSAGRAFVIKKGMSWPILFDVNSITRGLFGMGVPVTWFIDAKGNVTYKQIGLIHSDAILNGEVTKYLGIKL
jgi:thiol-disulfide isomerase/thioredoxin